MIEIDCRGTICRAACRPRLRGRQGNANAELVRLWRARAVLLRQGKGLFQDAGIDLEIQEGRGSGTVTQVVAAKTVQFGYVDVPTMMRAAVKGAPVRRSASRCRPIRCRRWVLPKRTSGSRKTSRARPSPLRRAIRCRRSGRCS